MPRGTKKNANQHNNKHENGVVAPGKRVIKQKSNGHLNGAPEGKPQAAITTAPVRSPSTPHTVTQLPYVSTNTSADSTKTGGDAQDNTEGLDGGRSAQADGVDSHFFGADGVDELAEQFHRKIDVNLAKSARVQNNGAFHLAVTILKSCPLRDTLAILIFLFSLPPTFLTLTNLLFAMLTFMPHTGTLTSLPSLNDIASGTPGAPSLITMCITDSLGILLWLVLFTPIQSLALDMAQAVVATTLGGGWSTKHGGSDNTLICMFIVLATHVSQYKGYVRRILGRDEIKRWMPWLEVSETSPTMPISLISSRWSLASWIHIFIALHILIQGLTQMVRRWYFKREYAQLISARKKSDPEAIAGSPNRTGSSSPAESCFNPQGSPTADLRAKSSLQSLKDVHDKASNGKKRKKQANWVRSQQPLWAAIASTKLNIVREYEQSHATSDAVESKATDSDNLGNAPFLAEDGLIWIKGVKPTSFLFDTSSFPSYHVTEHDSEDVKTSGVTNTHQSAPFNVRINGADWISTKIRPLACEEIKHKGQQWSGEVFGLSPSCTYQCMFLRRKDGVILHTATVSTPSSPINETANSAALTPPHSIVRPSSPTSPITTLKNSIAAYETSLSEATARLKRSRKENKAASATIRKDIDGLNNSISRMSASEKSQQSRHIQHSQHMRQAEDSMNSITEEIDVLVTIPETDSKEWKYQKSEWEKQKANISRIREDLYRIKESSQQESTAVQTEALSGRQKHERLLARTAKLNDQFNRLQSANAQGLDEKERRIAEQGARASEREQNEALYQEQLASLGRSLQETQYRGRQSWQQIQILEAAFEQQQLEDQRPVTPKGDLPGTVHSSSSAAFRFPSFGSPDTYMPKHGYNGSNVSSHNYGSNRSQSNSINGNRDRATSNVSGNSIYNDFDDQDPAPPMPTRATVEAMRGSMNERHASGSSGSAGNHSPMNVSPAVGPLGRGKGVSPN